MTDTVTLPRSVVELALDALKIGHESARDCAETFHIEMSGYKQQRHEALDAEVKQISDAIGVLRATLEQPQDHPEQHLDMVPEGWKLVPVEPTIRQMAAMGPAIRACYNMDGVSGNVVDVYRAMLAAAPKPPVVEQAQNEPQTRYLAGGARYKVVHLKTAGYCIHGLPREMLGQWVAFVDATDNKHMDSQPPQGVTQYPLPDDLYGGSKDWRAGSYAERVEWLHLSYEGAKREIARLEQPQSVTDCHQSQPQGESPTMTAVAHRKLDDLLTRGYQISGYSVYHDTKHRHGFVTTAGLVGWWKPDGAEYPQPQGEQEPLFWYRPCSDGLYEGPLHKSQIERVRKESGGWVPLYIRPQPPRQPLTDEQISYELNFAIETPTQAERAAFRKGIKLAERAHRIGGEA